MTVLVDTSALFALVNRADRNHSAAATWLAGPGRDSGEALLTHSYVVVESVALAQKRLPSEAVGALLQDLLPIMSTIFIDEALHRSAVAALLASGGRGPSLVDWVSFELMRHHGIGQAFAFDRDFRTAGFVTVP